MSVLLWILRILLAFWFITGGIYMMGHYEELANPWVLNILTKPLWLILGGFQILFALGLILPGVFKTLPKNSAFVSAVGLTVISLLGLILYIAYAGLPGILWGLTPSVLAIFIACKTKARS